MKLMAIPVLILPGGKTTGDSPLGDLTDTRWVRLTTELRQLCKIGSFKRAKQIATQMVDMAFSEDVGDETDIRIGGTLNNLALVNYKQGAYDDAESLYCSALSMTEKAVGSTHPNTAVILHNLALLYYRQNKYQTAEPICRRSLKITENTLGKKHRYMAMVLNTLTLICHDQGKYMDAVQLCEQSLAVRECILGENHPWLIPILQNIAELYRKAGNVSKTHIAEKRLVLINQRYRLKDRR